MKHGVAIRDVCDKPSKPVDHYPRDTAYAAQHILPMPIRVDLQPRYDAAMQEHVGYGLPPPEILGPEVVQREQVIERHIRLLKYQLGKKNDNVDNE